MKIDGFLCLFLYAEMERRTDLVKKKQTLLLGERRIFYEDYL